MKATAVAETLPAGPHVVELVGVEETKGAFDSLAWRWTFEAMSGEFAGRQVRKTTGPVPANDNSCGELIGQLLGRSLRRGEAVDTDKLSGPFAVVVAGGQIVRIAPAPVE